jgi:hypothetical protein
VWPFLYLNSCGMAALFNTNMKGFEPPTLRTGI